MSDRNELTEERAGAPARDPYLLAQVRESFGRVVYSHKTHEKQADICFSKHRWQQGVLIALTAISSGTFLVAVAIAAGRPSANVAVVQAAHLIPIERPYRISQRQALARRLLVRLVSEGLTGE
ncbi:hypothetical protein [Gordonia sp. (in: high G+C Gram-positive bacteria)]|uniref:hypothetical protein n=1 Tax=Gordonia sp. (in: high G+C Gram-positive bacteria) TaxID=84139 RepID=UPI003C781704